MPLGSKILLLCLIAILPISCQKNLGKECPCDHKKKKKNWLHINFNVEPYTCDFRKSSCRSTGVLTEMLYEGLMKVGRDGSIQPAQAKEVMISDDGLRYTFILDETYWSNGSRVKAQDFSSSWLACLDPNFPAVYAHLFYCIKNAQAAKEGRASLSEVGIYVEGENKLIIELESPTAYFLSLITSPWYCPTFLLKEEIKGDLSSDLVVNGPFKLHKWVPRSQICLVKNTYYRCAHQITLDGVDISLINDENTAAELFMHGDFDLLGMPFSPIPTDLAIPLKQKISSVPVGGVTVCCFNTTRSPFHHAKIRRAFSVAIDRRQMMDVLYPCAYAAASTLVPSVLFLPSKIMEHFKISNRSEELERARLDFEEGLTELGLDRNTFPTVRLAYNMHKGHVLFQKLAEVMQHDWRDVLGVQVELQGMDIHSLIQNMVVKDYDAVLITWSANYQDPMCFLDKFLTPNSAKNYPGWTHPDFSEIIIKSNGLLNVKKRMELLWQAERVFQKEAPCAPLFHWSYPIVTHDNVQGLYISPTGSVDFTSLRLVNNPDEKKK